MAKSPNRPQAPALSAEKAKEMSDRFDQVLRDYRGDAGDLESAIGMYVLGRHLGWKPLYIIHSKKTVAKYEEILGISVREEFPEEGLAVERSIGYKVAKGFSNFWKVVSGEEKIDRADRKEMT